MDIQQIRRTAQMSQMRLAALSGVSRWRITSAECGYLHLTAEEQSAIRDAVAREATKLSSALREVLPQGEPLHV